MDVFRIIKPIGEEVPLIISSPHSGTCIPPDIRDSLRPELAQFPDDTDWFIDKLYDFAPEMGITMICANYNRWVIDLNRAADSKPLYTDGRVITGLVPTTDFNGNSLYLKGEPDEAEVGRRIAAYYKPYHQMIARMLEEKLMRFGRVLLFDAHSIRKHVPGIRPEPFPDLILGDNDTKTASPELSDVAMNSLKHPDYSLEHNSPFKGGYITRTYGHPDRNIHALQLEMAKTNYMDDKECKYDTERAETIRNVLQKLFTSLIKELG